MYGDPYTIPSEDIATATDWVKFILIKRLDFCDGPGEMYECVDAISFSR